MATMYDSTQPKLIPANAEYIAVYYNGRYAADPVAVQREYPRARVFKIDVIGNAGAECGIADVESGDMRPADVPQWVRTRLQAHPDVLARVYCNESTWPSVRAAVAELDPGQRSHVRYWIADPTGDQHMVPGADATQYAWLPKYDISDINVSQFL